jgi:fluoride exporter
MMYNAILVGIGGGAGSVLRYFLQRWLNLSFPYGTFLVNLTGCFLIGIIWGLSARGFDEQKRLLLATGFCGGFTTFSAFSQEGMQMMVENRWVSFALYTAGSVFAGFLATFSGFKLTN